MTDQPQPDSSWPLDPPLAPEEARVLGCLIEKESQTPENYPLTQNACMAACNQKTSRHPVMKLDPGRVGQALRKLEQRDLVDSDFGARALRYRHRADAVLQITPAQRALIGLLLLRGPQTLSELFSRSERLHRFDELDDVEYELGRLATRTPALVVRLPRASGQREDRFMHRLCGPIASPGAASAAPEQQRSIAPALDQRLAELEQRVARLEASLTDHREEQ